MIPPVNFLSILYHIIEAQDPHSGSARVRAWDMLVTNRAVKGAD